MHCLITGINHKGEGVARLDGKVVFIPYALPGETVEVEIEQEKKHFARGKIQELLESSLDRENPRCPHYYACGGCAYQHVKYQRELELKRQVVVDNLKRIGGIDHPVYPVIGMDLPWCYRNKVTWHMGLNSAGKKVLGYYVAGSRDLLPIRDCLLIPQQLQAISSFFADNAGGLSGEQSASLMLRQSSYDKKTMVLFIECMPDKNLLKKLKGRIDSIYSYRHQQFKQLYGPAQMLEKAGNKLFYLSAASFFQVNPIMTEILLAKVKEYLNLQGREKVLDAYCGVGSIALNIAAQAAKVIGIEANEQAVEDARHNAELNHIDNCEFIAGLCEEVLKDRKYEFDAVVLDPPRAGLKKEVIQALIEAEPERIVYVSCNPSTLARDLKLLTADKYSVSQIQPLDMFPRTSHVECVVLITRVKD